MAIGTVKIDLEHILSMMIDHLAAAQEAELLSALSPSYETFETKRRRLNFYNELILHFAEIYFINKKAQQYALRKTRKDENLYLTLENNHKLFLEKIATHVYFYNQYINHASEQKRLNENYFTLFHR